MKRYYVKVVDPAIDVMFYVDGKMAGEYQTIEGKCVFTSVGDFARLLYNSYVDGNNGLLLKIDGDPKLGTREVTRAVSIKVHKTGDTDVLITEYPWSSENFRLVKDK